MEQLAAEGSRRGCELGREVNKKLTPARQRCDLKNGGEQRVHRMGTPAGNFNLLVEKRGVGCKKEAYPPPGSVAV